MTDTQADILVVEDEPAQQEILAYNLKSAGFSVRIAENGDDADLELKENPPDLVILDWMLPGQSGLEICRKIRARKATRAIPIIMLTARSEEADMIRGLDLGADDFIAKPYSVAELLARTRSLLRRTSAVEGETLKVGDIVLNLAEHRAYVGAKQVALGPTEFRLLRTLMERPGRVFDRNQLLDRAWGRDIFVGSRTVDVHIGRLRRSLGDDAGNAIRTVRGAGYSLG